MKLKFANKDERNMMNRLKEKFKYLDTDSIVNAQEYYYICSNPRRYGLSASREF